MEFRRWDHLLHLPMAEREVRVMEMGRSAKAHPGEWAKPAKPAKPQSGEWEGMKGKIQPGEYPGSNYESAQQREYLGEHTSNREHTSTDEPGYSESTSSDPSSESTSSDPSSDPFHALEATFREHQEDKDILFSKIPRRPDYPRFQNSYSDGDYYRWETKEGDDEHNNNNNNNTVAEKSDKETDNNTRPPRTAVPPQHKSDSTYRPPPWVPESDAKLTFKEALRFLDAFSGKQNAFAMVFNERGHFWDFGVAQKMSQNTAGHQRDLAKLDVLKAINKVFGVSSTSLSLKY
jgi:hypothetical protein